MDNIERIHAAKRSIEDLKKRIKDAKGFEIFHIYRIVISFILILFSLLFILLCASISYETKW